MELLLPSLAFALRKSYFPVVSRIGLLLFMSQLDVSLNVCFFSSYGGIGAQIVQSR